MLLPHPLRELKTTKEVGKYLHRDTFSEAFPVCSVYEKPSQGRKHVKQIVMLNPHVQLGTFERYVL